MLETAPNGLASPCCCTVWQTVVKPQHAALQLPFFLSFFFFSASAIVTNALCKKAILIFVFLLFYGDHCCDYFYVCLNVLGFFFFPLCKFLFYLNNMKMKKREANLNILYLRRRRHEPTFSSGQKHITLPYHTRSIPLVVHLFS